MSTTTATLKYDATTAANLQPVGDAIHSALVTTAGWTQTTDTGQYVLTQSITSIGRALTVTTLTFAAPHGLIAGQQITVVTSGTFSPTANVTNVAISTVPSATTLTYTSGSGTITAGTADTGTVTQGLLPVSAFQYRIYKMSDSLQSTCPCFLKVRVGRSSLSPVPTVPQIGFSFGQGTDGAGNLTGGVSGEALMVASSTTLKGALTYTAYFSGSTSRFMCCLWQALGAEAAIFLQVERSKDNTGADTGEYFTFVCGFSASIIWLQSIFANGASTTKEVTGYPGSFPTNREYAGSFYFEELCPLLGKKGRPMIAGIVNFADVSNLSTPSIDFYGTTHTLLAFGGGTQTTPFQYALSGGSSQAAILLRYE